MASGRILHSGNLVRCICAGDILLKDGRKKNELGDFRSKEEVAWLEEHFIDFAREQ